MIRIQHTSPLGLTVLLDPELSTTAEQARQTIARLKAMCWLGVFRVIAVEGGR